MYTLYWDRRTRAASIHMMLEEAGIPYRLKQIDLHKGEHKSPDYLAINPKGLVPAPDDPDRGQFLDWFFFHLSVLQEPYKRFHFPKRYSTDSAHTDGTIRCASQDIATHWNHLEVHLAENGPYHLGERFGLNDILLATYYVFGNGLSDFRAKYVAVSRCFELVKSRPALNAILVEHETPTT